MVNEIVYLFQIIFQIDLTNIANKKRSLGCVLFELVALKKFVESDNLTGFMITITQKLEILLKTYYLFIII